MMSVFSDQQERPTVVASDPQRGVGLDQTPLRVLATTARSRRRTSADVRRLAPAVQVHFARHPVGPGEGSNRRYAWIVVPFVVV
jgi:hypothetical protein